MIVVVGGIKGGSGKSTISTNLCVICSSEGHKVLLVDADPQKSSSMFSSQRESLGINTKWTTVQLSGINVHKELFKLKPNFDYIIVDTGGRDTGAQRSALVAADVFLSPFNPSSYDIWTAPSLKNMLNEMKLANPKMRCLVFINKADPIGTYNEDSQKILEKYEEFECLKFVVGNRKTFKKSSDDGLGVTEVPNPDKKAVQEMRSLYEYIFNTPK